MGEKPAPLWSSMRWELFATLDMSAWILLKPQLKRLVPGVKLGDLDRARNEQRRVPGLRPLPVALV